jgi:glycosyltransferase involved in cell wall biosynthesis
MPRLMYLSTVPMALRHLAEGQLAYFREHGFEVIAVSSPGEDLDVVGRREEVQVVGVPMEREIRPLADLVSLVRLVRLLRKVRPDAVMAGTAKAGLLGMIAAWLCRVPARIYHLRGFRMATTRGIKRRVMALTERIAAACAHRIVCVSESLRREFVSHGLTSADKTVVFLHGSSNGVDARPMEQTSEVRVKATILRRQWGVPVDAPIVGFVGRFVRDKGFVELVDAFEEVLVARPDAWLLLVGDYESGDPVPDEYIHHIAQHPRIIRPGFIRELAPYFGAMSVLALPTYREGFPNVVLQAGAAELPVVAFRAIGAMDAVEDGVTGTLVPLRDAAALAKALLSYLNDPGLRIRHGRAGRERVLHDFRPEPIWAAMEVLLRELLGDSTADHSVRVGRVA